MREPVEQDQIASARKRRNDPSIRKIAGAKDAGGRSAFKARKLCLKLGEQGMIASDKARGARARAVALDCRNRRGFHRRVALKSRRVGAREREKPAAVPRDPQTIAAEAVSERPAQAGVLKLLEFAMGEIIQGAHWNGASRLCTG